MLVTLDDVITRLPVMLIVPGDVPGASVPELVSVPEPRLNAAGLAVPPPPMRTPVEALVRLLPLVERADPPLTLIVPLLVFEAKLFTCSVPLLTLMTPPAALVMLVPASPIDCDAAPGCLLIVPRLLS